MTLLPPLPGDDQRAMDILDEIRDHYFTPTNCRMRFDEAKRAVTIDWFSNTRVNGVEVAVIGGRWVTIAECSPSTGRWAIVAHAQIAEHVIRGMLEVMTKTKSHLVYNIADHNWVLCIGDDADQYRGVAQLSQITPKRYDWRPLEEKGAKVQ